MNEYTDWSREKLIEHISAYSDGIHQLANIAMTQAHEIRKLKERLGFIEATRQAIHAA